MAYRQRWTNYSYEDSRSPYEYEKLNYAKYDKRRLEVYRRPALNLQADEATLNCLKWLLITRDVDFEIKSPPQLEDVDYESSDEDIWDPLPVADTLPNPYSKRRDLIKINVTCEWQRCNAQFADNVEYRAHIEEHFEELAGTSYKEYHCEWDLCGYKTDNIVMFERHVKHHEMHGRFLSAGEAVEIMKNVPRCNLGGVDRNRLPELLEDFPCEWDDCTHKFRALSRLYDHILEHVELYLRPDNSTYNCQWRGCAFTSAKKYRLRRHIKVSHANSTEYACRKCGATRKNLSTFLGHFLSQAAVKNPHLCCPHCNQLFLKETHLRTHLKNRHQGFVCEICHQKFLGKHQLNIHVANVHVKLRPFQCNDCEKAFPTKNNLRAHMHVHNKNENGYQCSNCDYKVSSYLALRKHNYLVHMGRNNPYECHLCGKQLKLSTSMSTHLKNVHDIGVPEGFHRYTYRLEDGLVFRLRTTKTYERNATGEDKPRCKISLPPLKPVKVNFNVEVNKKVVKVDLQTIAMGPEEIEALNDQTNDPVPGTSEEGAKQMLTRAAKKLLTGGKP